MIFYGVYRVKAAVCCRESFGEVGFVVKND